MKKINIIIYAATCLLIAGLILSNFVLMGTSVIMMSIYLSSMCIVTELFKLKDLLPIIEQSKMYMDAKKNGMLATCNPEAIVKQVAELDQ